MSFLRNRTLLCGAELSPGVHCTNPAPCTPIFRRRKLVPAEEIFLHASLMFIRSPSHEEFTRIEDAIMAVVPLASLERKEAFFAALNFAYLAKGRPHPDEAIILMLDMLL